MGMTATATKLITRFGQTGVLRQPGEPSGDPYNPTPGPDVEFTVTVAVTEFTFEQRASEMIADTVLRVFMAVSDGVPTTADKLEFGGTEYSIQRVGVLGPDGVTICYDLQVRA
ncbi:MULTISPECIES: hypothetical protein [unclassified Sulfitobacter]|uniref:hypothetical protein n=1 Tax=unclassified Sulfitobacter TaxID=196795 RepID=UPI003745FE44